MRNIEYVCTGNRGRSPVAELVAGNYLEELDAVGKYGATSSGTAVAGIKAGKLSVPFMAQVVGMARDRDLYKDSEVSLVNRAIEEQDEAALTGFYARATAIFGEEEERYRAEVLPELGIAGKVKILQEQTIARPDTVAVLSMAGRNNDQVRKIYEGSGFDPVIAVLSAHAHDDPTVEIPNAFGKDRDAYVVAITAIVRDVPKGIDRLLARG